MLYGFVMSWELTLPCSRSSRPKTKQVWDPRFLTTIDPKKNGYQSLLDFESSQIRKEKISYLESGCSKHDKKCLFVDQLWRKAMTCNNCVKTRGYETISNGAISFNKVAYIEGLEHNLLSIGSKWKRLEIKAISSD